MIECLIKELVYRTSRSSGPGGQHVNKTESRVELIWDPGMSVCLDDEQRSRVRQFLGSRLTGQGILVLASEKYRSQHRNKEEVTGRFVELVTRSMVPRKKRVSTRPTRSSQERRIRQKKIRGEVKKHRREPPKEE